MLPTNLKIWLAALAVLAAVIILTTDPAVAQGTGLIVATLAAGAGWLFRDVNDEARAVRNICQAYAAVVETHFEEVSDTISDDELARFLRLAPAIVSGDEPESIGSRAADPYAGLPDLHGQMHLLSQDTVRLLWKWRVRDFDLLFVYDELGTKRLSVMGEERLEKYFEWVRKYRDEYRDVGYTALVALRAEFSGLKVNLERFEAAGAKRLP